METPGEHHDGSVGAPQAPGAGSGASLDVSVGLRDAGAGAATTVADSLASLEALESSPADSPVLLAAQSAFLSAAQSLILERQKFARRFHVSGFDQFSGTRRINEVLGYPTSLSLADYRDRFDNGGIARRIILMAPEAMGWSKVAIVENRTDLKRKTKLEQAWDSLCKRLNVGNIFKRADIQAGIGEYSVIYIGVKEKKGANASSTNIDILAQEMPRLTGPDDIVFLRPLPQDQAQITEFVGDSTTDRVDDPRYGLPKYYNIQLSRARRHIAGTGPATLNSTIRKVHWSRVIHVTHEPLDNEIYSTPELQPIWHYLCDLDKLAGGGSEIFWKQALQKVLFDLDKDIGPDGTLVSGTAPIAPIDPAKLAAFKESKEQLKTALEEMEHNLRSSVLSRGVTPKTFGAAAPNFAENVKTIIGLIAATKNKPQRKLTGSEVAHVSSTQDEKSDNDTIAARQDEYGSALVRDFVNRLIKYNGLPAAKDDYDIEWPTEDEMSELDKAKLVNLLTLANLNQYKADGTIVQTNNEIRDTVYDLDALAVPDEPKPVALPVMNDPALSGDTAQSIDPVATEVAANEQHKYSSTQIDITEPTRNAILALGLLIANEDLAQDGRELNPHVTVKYGIETDNSALVATLIQGFGSIALSIGETDIFSSAEFDVVYLSVVSEDLVRLNELISSTLKVTDTHPEYVPHVTLAYVKSGTGAKYRGLKLTDSEVKLILSDLTFSSSDGTTTSISTL